VYDKGLKRRCQETGEHWRRHVYKDPRHCRCQVVFCDSSSNQECASFPFTPCLADIGSCLIVSKVDYCNSVLAGVSRQLQDQLQSVLNAAARLVFSARRSEHITPLLQEPHWLKVPERIRYRLCVLAYRYAISIVTGSLLSDTHHDAPPQQTEVHRPFSYFLQYTGTVAQNWTVQSCVGQ